QVCGLLAWVSPLRNGIQGGMSLGFRGGRGGDIARWPSLCRHAGRLEIVRSVLPRRMTTALIGRVGLLMCLHQRQRRAQSFVLDDLAGLDGLDFIEAPERKRDTLKLTPKGPAVLFHN